LASPFQHSSVPFSWGHSAKNDLSMEVLRDFCTRETFLRSVPCSYCPCAMLTREEKLAFSGTCPPHPPPLRVQYALEKQVFINKFQIPQLTTTKRRAQVVQWTDHPFPVGGSRFESTGTLTSLRIVQRALRCYDRPTGTQDASIEESMQA
jgi:hypothetical protein